jgi:hypothetical protein
MREHMRAELTIAALIMAIQRRRPVAGLIHHSERRLRPVIATSPSKCCDDHLSPGYMPPASIATSCRLPPSPHQSGCLRRGACLYCWSSAKTAERQNAGSNRRSWVRLALVSPTNRSTVQHLPERVRAAFAVVQQHGSHRSDAE